ncbi:hypothetical protein FWH13_03885 [Candidatus Saccharibacteria bacterium]|nr:hypothetical protein [Candidatus Saccharibacteria bacterium]
MDTNENTPDFLATQATAPPKPSTPDQPAIITSPPTPRPPVPRNRLVTILLPAIAVALIAAAAVYVFLLRPSGDDTPDDNTPALTSVTGLETDIRNYRLNLIMYSTSPGGSSQMVLSGVHDVISGTQRADIHITTPSDTVQSEMYSDTVNNITYTWDSLSRTWLRETSVNQPVDLPDLITRLSRPNSATRVASGVYHVNVPISEFSTLIRLTTGGIENPLDDGDTYATVTVEDGFITQIEYDLSSHLSFPGRVTISIHLSDFNQAGTVTIPNSVTRNVTTID